MVFFGTAFGIYRDVVNKTRVMKIYRVRLYTRGIYQEPEYMRNVTIEANSQEEAEQLAKDKYNPYGWVVYDSKEVTD